MLNKLEVQGSAGVLIMQEKKVIAIADDDPDTLELLQEFLMDYQVRCFQRPKDLLFALEPGNLPDLIISDVMMNQMDGYALCEAVKKQDELKHIPVLLISGYGDKVDFRKAIECGANEYLEKPVTIDALKRRVCEQLGEQTDNPIVSPLN